MYSMNHVFANHSKDKDIFPITIHEIAEEQHKDKSFDALKTDEKYEVLLIENTKVICKDHKLVTPKSLQKQVVQWYHHYLQHPRHTQLEETLHCDVLEKYENYYPIIWKRLYALQCIGKV